MTFCFAIICYMSRQIEIVFIAKVLLFYMFYYVFFALYVLFCFIVLKLHIASRAYVSSSGINYQFSKRLWPFFKKVWLLFFIVHLFLTLSWLRSQSYRNQSIDLQSKSVDWFLYDRDLCHERVKERIVGIQECTDIFYWTQTLSQKACVFFKNLYMFFENTCPCNQSIF